MNLKKRDLQYILRSLKYSKDMLYTDKDIKELHGKDCKKYIKKRDEIRNDIDKFYYKLEVYYNKVYEKH